MENTMFIFKAGNHLEIVETDHTSRSVKVADGDNPLDFIEGFNKDEWVIFNSASGSSIGFHLGKIKTVDVSFIRPASWGDEEWDGETFLSVNEIGRYIPIGPTETEELCRMINGGIEAGEYQLSPGMGWGEYIATYMTEVLMWSVDQLDDGGFVVGHGIRRVACKNAPSEPTDTKVYPVGRIISAPGIPWEITLQELVALSSKENSDVLNDVLRYWEFLSKAKGAPSTVEEAILEIVTKIKGNRKMPPLRQVIKED